MSTIRKSLAFSLADSYLSFPLQLIGTMVISRLLTPNEIGTYAVAAVFTTLASTFRDFGVAEYLIQEKEITTDKIRAALTVNIAVSWLMGLLLLAIAPFAADFYRTPGVREVMHVTAMNFVLIPFGAVTMAWFRRELNFKPIFVASVLANLTTFAVTIACASMGLGYMSLAWSALSGVLVTVAVSVWFRPPNFPRWPGLRGVSDVFRFGRVASGIYIFGQLGKGAPEMIIGRAQDVGAVAMFSRGSGLVELFNRTVVRAVMPVCLPYFAKNNREQGELVGGYLKSVAMLTAVGWTFMGLMALLAFPAIRIIYGAQWVAAVPLAQILCLVGALELIHLLAKEALLAVGDVKRANRLQLLLQSSRIVGLMAVVPFGLVGACWGLLGAALVGLGVSHRYLMDVVGLRTRDLVVALLPGLYIAVCALAPLAVLTVAVGATEQNYLLWAVVGGCFTAGAWLLALKLFNHPLWAEVQRLAGGLAARLPWRRAT